MLSVQSVLRLQRTVGNRVVQRILLGPPQNDPSEAAVEATPPTDTTIKPRRRWLLLLALIAFVAVVVTGVLISRGVINPFGAR